MMRVHDVMVYQSVHYVDDVGYSRVYSMLMM